MEYSQILELVREVGKAGLSHFEYTEGNLHFSMSCPEKETVIVHENIPSMPAAKINVSKQEAAMSADSLKEETGEAQGTPVKSPLVGTFYAAPSEDAEPYVKVGDRVKKGQVLAIVEAMKLMNEIESECEGLITKVLVDNGNTVEYGQPLFYIDETK